MARKPIVAIDQKTAALMGRVRQQRTTPEEIVAKALRALGMRYRRNVRTLPGRPDFANRSGGWAINVHGCFWHNHDCKRGTLPKHNADFWIPKLAANKARDARVEEQLSEAGLCVLTVWECETKQAIELERELSEFFAQAKVPVQSIVAI